MGADTLTFKAAVVLWHAADRLDSLSARCRRTSGDLQGRATGSRLTLWRRDVARLFDRTEVEA